MKISVIIPTHNRLLILKKCLSALEKQDFDTKEFEVLVVDDGSQDGTKDLGCKISEKYRLTIKYVYQEQGGPSKARNKGISEARGEILLFIGDDIIASESFVSAHYGFHSSQNTAVLGKIEWDPEIEITEFMRYLENGIQFDYNNISSVNISYKNCYTSNISVKRDFLVKNNLMFAEEFPYAAYEDIEWGYRMMKKGIKFLYQPCALAFHNHPVSIESYCRRMVLAGKAYAYMLNIHPEMKPLKQAKPQFYKLLLKGIKATIRGFFLKHGTLSICRSSREKWIKTILSYYEEKGVYEAMKNIK